MHLGRLSLMMSIKRFGADHHFSRPHLFLQQPADGKLLQKCDNEISFRVIDTLNPESRSR